MTTSDIIKIALIAVYAIGWIAYIIMWALQSKRKQEYRANDWYVSCNLVADLMEQGIEIPKEFLIKLLRNQLKKEQLKEITKVEQPKPEQPKVEKPTNEIPVGTPPSVVVCENK